MWLTDAVLTQVWEEQLAWRKGRAAFEVAEALAAKVLHGIVAFSQCGSVLQLIEGYFNASTTGPYRRIYITLLYFRTICSGHPKIETWRGKFLAETWLKFTPGSVLSVDPAIEALAGPTNGYCAGVRDLQSARCNTRE